MGLLEGLPFGPILNGSGWAVAFWVTWFVARMVYTGALVPRTTHEDTVRALEIERKRNELLSEQVGKLVDSVETVEMFLRALPSGPGTTPPRPRGGGR